MYFTFSTFNESVVGLMEGLNLSGQEVTVKGKKTLEFSPATFTVKSPSKNRFPTLRHRNANIFAQVAETLWVLGGRDDMEYLSRYLPRAKDFSDDGERWRAAYGPRIRCWETKLDAWYEYDGSIDQLANVVNALKEDKETRQAIISIWNPAEDWVKSKDIPCNNWIQFMIRDSQLIMNVVVRSNDAMWGYSGINFFEWSTLQQLVADLVGVGVGPINWFAGSFHLYEQHFKRASAIVDGYHDLYVADCKAMYDGFMPMESEIYDLETLDKKLKAFFDWEATFSQSSVEELENLDYLSDTIMSYNYKTATLFNNMSMVIVVYHVLNAIKQTLYPSPGLYKSLANVLNMMPPTELRHAVYGEIAKVLGLQALGDMVPLSAKEARFLAEWTGLES